MFVGAKETALCMNAYLRQKCVHVCLCMSGVCVCVRVYVHVYVCVYLCVYMYVCVYVYVYMCVYLCVYRCRYVCICRLGLSLLCSTIILLTVRKCVDCYIRVY